jgi:hypothetical protein
MCTSAVFLELPLNDIFNKRYLLFDKCPVLHGAFLHLLRNFFPQT